ncbi:MAG: hypothetical protein ABSA76_07190 [Bacteroidales bacterium]
MKKHPVLSFICTTIFIIGIIAIILASRIHYSVTPALILLAVSLIYVFSGWYLFRGYYPEGSPLLLFFTGYLYASVFIAFSFKAGKWPLAATMLYLAPAWAVAQLVITVLIRKKLSKEGLIQMVTEGVIMLALSVVLLFRS